MICNFPFAPKTNIVISCVYLCLYKAMVMFVIQ